MTTTTTALPDQLVPGPTKVSVTLAVIPCRSGIAPDLWVRYADVDAFDPEDCTASRMAAEALGNPADVELARFLAGARGYRADDADAVVKVGGVPLYHEALSQIAETIEGGEAGYGPEWDWPVGHGF